MLVNKKTYEEIRDFLTDYGSYDTGKGTLIAYCDYRELGPDEYDADVKFEFNGGDSNSLNSYEKDKINKFCQLIREESYRYVFESQNFYLNGMEESLLD